MTQKPCRFDLSPDNFLAGIGADLKADELGLFWLICLRIYSAGGPIPYDEESFATQLHRTDLRVIKRASARLQQLDKITVSAGQVMANFAPVDHALTVVHIGDGSTPRQNVSASLRQEIFERDDGACVYCGSRNGPWEIDHVFPFSRGGQTSVENLALACSPCNRAKRDMTPEEWLS